MLTNSLQSLNDLSIVQPQIIKNLLKESWVFTMTNLKDIEQIANKFGNDLVKINNEINRIASQKSRLKKQKGRKDYEKLMNEILKYDQVLKEAKGLIKPTEKFVTTFEKSDIDLLDYDETVKAIKSIQSKKTNSRWLTTVEGDNDEYRNAVKIEQMLVEHRNSIKPVEETLVRKSEIQTIIETIESNEELSQERIVELLKSLL